MEPVEPGRNDRTSSSGQIESEPHGFGLQPLGETGAMHVLVLSSTVGLAKILYRSRPRLTPSEGRNLLRRLRVALSGKSPKTDKSGCGR
jgi:hypothetical protein